MLGLISRYFFLYIVLLLVAAQQGFTHPHMFFTMRPHVIYNATGVTEIVVQWELDEFNSEMFINDCDANGNFEIDEEEMPLVRKNYTDTYAKENYYLSVYEGRSREPIDNVDVSLKRVYIRNRQIRLNLSIDYPIPFRWKTQVIILRFSEPRNLFSFVYNNSLDPRYTKNTDQETPPVKAKYNAKYPNHIFVQVGKTGKIGEGVATVGEEDIESLFEGIGEAPGRGSSLKAQFFALQAQYNKKVSDLVMQAKTSLSVGMVLLILGFAYLYGMLHSAGPGHGKTFVVGFFLQHHAPWYQAIVFAFMIAAIHIGSAILLSTAFLTLLSNYSGMERLMLQVNLSFGIAVFIFSLGVYLLIQQIRHHHSHAEGHSHDHHHSHHSHPRDHSHEHAHPREHSHEEEQTQGHAHSHSHLEQEPTKQVQMSMGRMAVAAGIIPCPLSITIMLLAVTKNMFFLGALTVLGIALGIVTVLSTVGMLTIKTKATLQKYSDRKPGQLGLFVHEAMHYLGAVLIILLGIGLGFLYMPTF